MAVRGYGNIIALILLISVQSSQDVSSNIYQIVNQASCSNPEYSAEATCEYYRQETELSGIFMHQCCNLAQKLRFTIERVKAAESNQLITVLLQESVFYKTSNNVN